MLQSPSLRFFKCIPASGAAAAAVYRNSIKTFFAMVEAHLFINGRPGFSNGPRSFPRNPPGCIILDS